MSRDEVENAFTHHPPKGDRVHRYQLIREAGKQLAVCIVDNCPASPERAEALIKAREVVMMANAAIACNE